MGDGARVAHRVVSDLFFASSRAALGDSGRDAAREYYVGLPSIEFELEVEGGRVGLVVDVMQREQVLVFERLRAKVRARAR